MNKVIVLFSICVLSYPIYLEYYDVRVKFRIKKLVGEPAHEVVNELNELGFTCRLQRNETYHTTTYFICDKKRFFSSTKHFLQVSVTQPSGKVKSLGIGSTHDNS